MSSLVIISAVLTFCLGISLYIGNPNRNSYKAFCLLCVILTLWLICVFGAMISGEQLGPNRLQAITLWLKANAFISSKIRATSLRTVSMGTAHPFPADRFSRQMY